MTSPATPQDGARARVAAARQEIERRREQAKAATAGPWRKWNDGHVGAAHQIGGLLMPTPGCPNDIKQQVADAAFIAANDPSFVLAVLDAAEATLERHARANVGKLRAAMAHWPWPLCYWCERQWPCADVTAVLAIFAPVVAPLVTPDPS